MKNFMISDLNIKKTVLACFVEAGTGANCHFNRPSHGLALFCGGKRVFDFGDNKVNAFGDTIVYFPKSSSYYITSTDITDCYAINFELEEGQKFEPFSFPVVNLQTYLPDFENAKNLWSSPSSSSRAKIKSILYNIIYKMQSEYEKTATGKSKGQIDAALDLIYNNYLKENIPVSHLAKISGISEVYLRKLFIKKFGMPPNKYIKKLRLEYAENLLLSGFYKVADVCYMSGFNDESYFNREFKKHFGVSPSKYKNI